ncbi:Ribonuclease Y [Caprobacter fermentans]|uniref:bis(5'-nucleosyl)-tetraphosphatase (symmetrical) n=1 Tax=Caproicibacter fermentans TaxID=2576756 RepID=A0A6N8I1V1_9FIRM|nr:bis(5'-nucleosyl)-tetraphosphatase (symmetrical) YqeK [Caproicibacter fermentans]MVB11898.1 Ribonuclease Y [Caproicibacter fermentans]OCM99865.1 phosphohydrolase [Clostridium sp. W14A]QNK41134.1 bis(5'-nucleosyl)-tetraphosphatase (symmetrical) YqeK [Caproicibacter fermentans]
MNLESYKSAIRGLLGDKRYEHSVCVARAAVSLAQKYGADEKKAETAGILHDIMKDLPQEEQKERMRQYGIRLTDVEKNAPKLWHAILASEYIRRELGVTDPEILQAVRYHTTGRKNMTLLDKILFIADFISDDRDYPGVDKLRQAAKNSLEQAMIEGIVFTVKDLADARRPIHPDTIAVYNQTILQNLSIDTNQKGC